MTVIALSLVAGLCFGALVVAVRFALSRGGDPEAGAVASASIAAVIALIATVATGVVGDIIDLGELWPFLIMGAAVPGLSQVLFIHSVRTAGPSRAAVLIGTAPVLSALLAIAFLGERPHAALGIGTALIVLGGAALAYERVRPVGFRVIGALLALSCAGLFAVRDNVVRWASEGKHPPPLVAATTSLLAASVSVSVILLVTNRQGLGARARRAYVAFLPAGVLLGLAYVALLQAFAHGAVTIVAPLNATQSLWAVLLSAILVGRSEAIGWRLIAATLLIVAGSALVSAFR